MKIVINLIALFLISGSVLCQTNVGGPLFTSTIWQASGSPYQITSDVQLPPGVTLTIDPGCVINFTGQYEILVQGAVIVEGTSAQPIKINGTPSLYKPMFILRRTNLDNCKFSFVEMTGDKLAIQVGEHYDTILNTGTLKLSHLKVIDSHIQTKGKNTNASVELSNSMFTGGSVESYHYWPSEPISINTSTFNGSWIGAGSQPGTITLNNCHIESSDLFTTFGKLKLMNCKINDSHFGNVDNGGSGVDMIGCELNNTTVWLMKPVNFSDCIINTGNTYGIVSGGGVIECTKQTGNGLGTGFQFGYGGQVSIYKSSITSNSVGIWARNVSSFYCDSVNIFNNTTYNIVSDLPGNISLTNVYWGSTDSSTIASKIFDYYDNINAGKCYFPNPQVSQVHSPSCAVTLTVAAPLTTGIINVAHEVDVRISPNPATSHINLDFRKQLPSTIEIYSVEGKLVKRSSLNPEAVSVDISDLPSGLYFVKVQDSEIPFITKFIKE